MLLLLILFASTAAFVSACTSRAPATVAVAPREASTVSFTSGSRDVAGRFMGGTEMRVLAAHGGKLYAGNGYWEDRPGPEGLQGAQVLVLESPAARWRVDHAFDESLPNGRRRDLAVSALEEVTFATDGLGAPLPVPVSMLIAANWDLSGATRVFSRDDATSTWAATMIAQDRPTTNFLPQVRSFGRHRDRATGVDRVFAGQDPRGIFSGTYDPATLGRIRWDAAPELELSGVSSAGLSGRNGYLRVSSFTECNGRLYVAIGQQIYERVDGVDPHWRLLYTNRAPGHSETGLRGLTAILGPAGHAEVLLAAVEGSAARIVRIDPDDGGEVTEVDLPDLLGRQWGMPVGYVIAAYNDMAKARDSGGGGEALLIGLEAFIPMRAPIAAGHSVVNVGYGRLEAGGWYLVRHATGSYELRQVGAPPGHALVAIRSIRVSPFPEEGPAVYFAGYDANKAPAHNTAWILRASTTALLGTQPR